MSSQSHQPSPDGGRSLVELGSEEKPPELRWGKQQTYPNILGLQTRQKQHREQSQGLAPFYRSRSGMTILARQAGG